MKTLQKRKIRLWGGTILLSAALFSTSYSLQKENKRRNAFFPNRVKEAEMHVEAWMKMYLEPQIEEIKQQLYFSPSKNAKDLYPSSLALEKEIERFYPTFFLNEKTIQKIKK